MSIAIKVENLSKAYQLGEIGTGTISRDLERYWAKLRGKEDPFLRIGETNDRSTKGESDIVWSLKDINFEINQGDAVGIIGRNGAGKSTLLKILSRVTSPTTGSVKVKGRIASLLEVGTGFHPELSGRENIFLNGAILGMRKAEIKKHFDAIVDFAGVERYIDTPVKRYSSGMYVRLAFAVAAHLESEILVVDEVLAVGDAEFQKKCLGKMGDLSKGEGRTVLFVSHNMQAVSALCNSGIVMKQGFIGHIGGQIQESISYYLQGASENKPEYIKKSFGDKPEVVQVKISTSENNNVQRNGKKMIVDFWVNIPNPITGASLSFVINDNYDNKIVHIWTFDSEKPMFRTKGIAHLRCVISNLKLYMGRYSLSIFLANSKENIMYQNEENICPFEVVMDKYRGEYEWQPNTCKYIEEFEWDILKS